MKPLQLDDGQGVEDLHVGLLKERVTGVPCGESLRGVDAFKLPAWRREVWWPGLSSSLEEAEDFSPYPPVDLETYL